MGRSISISGDPYSAGIVYSSSGEPFVAEGLRSARSSLRHNSLPHLLFASPMPAEARRPPGLSIEPFEPSDNPKVDKIANIQRSPFERTIFLDSDTYVVDEIAHVLQLLDRYDMAVAHAPGYRGLPDPEVPTAFYELNTGVIAWRANERTAAFMASWQETYTAWLRDEPFRGAGLIVADQPSFRHCAWTQDVRLIVLAPEYNLRLTYPATVAERVRLIHGRHRDHERLAARLNKRAGPRIFLPRHRLMAVRSRLARVIRG